MMRSNNVDVVLTYILLCCAVVLLQSSQVVSSSHHPISNDNEPKRHFVARGHWQVSSPSSSSSSSCLPLRSFTHGCCSVAHSFTHSDGSVGNGSMHQILQQWSNKIITFAGDSLTQQTYDSIHIALQLEQIEFKEVLVFYDCPYQEGRPCQLMAPQNRCISDDTVGRNYRLSFDSEYKLISKELSMCITLYQTTIMKYNVTINYLHNYEWFVPSRFLPKDYYDPLHNILHHTLFEQFTHDSDVMLVNVGAHYQRRSGVVITQLIRYVREVLEDDMRKNNRKRHIFRMTFPSHFGHNSMYEIWNKSEGCIQNSIPTWTEAIAKQFIGNEIYVMDYNHVMHSRGELHSRINKEDCLHWCYSYELFYPFYQLLSKIITSTH